MVDYTDNGLKASIKALSGLVMPALDSANPLASEQLRLVIGTLQSLRRTLPHMHERDFFELVYYLELARRLGTDAALVSKEIAEQLAAVVNRAQGIVEQASIPKATGRHCVLHLAAAISALVRAAARADAGLRDRIEKEVLSSGKSLVTLQRVWFSQHGFELHPNELPSLEQALKVAQAP